jgi:hypothetical protein
MPDQNGIDRIPTGGAMGLRMIQRIGLIVPDLETITVDNVLAHLTTVKHKTPTRREVSAQLKCLGYVSEAGIWKKR